MDHFSPSYFALLGPLERAESAGKVLKAGHLRLLNAFREKGARFMVGGGTAMALYGIRCDEGVLQLLLDPDGNSLGILQRVLLSENLKISQAPFAAQPGTEGGVFALEARFEKEGGVQVKAVRGVPLTFDEVYDRRTTFKTESVIVDAVSIGDLARISSAR